MKLTEKQTKKNGNTKKAKRKKDTTEHEAAESVYDGKIAYSQRNGLFYIAQLNHYLIEQRCKQMIT